MRTEVIAATVAFFGLLAGGIAAWTQINARVASLETDIVSLSNRLNVEREERNLTAKVLTEELIKLIKVVHEHEGRLNERPGGPR